MLRMPVKPPVPFQLLENSDGNGGMCRFCSEIADYRLVDHAGRVVFEACVQCASDLIIKVTEIVYSKKSIEALAKRHEERIRDAWR